MSTQIFDDPSLQYLNLHKLGEQGCPRTCDENQPSLKIVDAQSLRQKSKNAI